MSNRSYFTENPTLVREVRDRYVNVGLPGTAPQASGIVTVSGSGTLTTIVTINGTAVTQAWGTSNTATATALASAINSNTTINKFVTASSSGANVLLVSQIPGPLGAAVTVVVSGTAASTYNYSTEGTLVGGGNEFGSSLVPQIVLTLTSASGSLALTVNGIVQTTATTASGGDGPTAVAWATAINLAANGLNGLVTAYVGTTTLTNATVVLNLAAGVTQSLTVSASGTGVTQDRIILSSTSSGLKGWPENKGIGGFYQLNTGYYMLTMGKAFKELLDTTADFLLASATPPPATKPWVVVDAFSGFSTGYLLLNHMAAGDTITINGTTFTCETSGASGNQFNVGTHDSNTATNIATVVNTVLGPAGFTATAIATAPSSSNGGAVVLSSLSTHIGFTASSQGVRAMCIPSNGAFQDGGGVILCTLANAGVVPTENTSATDLKMNMVLNAGNASVGG